MPGNPTGKGGFRKGRSGNPGGRPPGWQQVKHASERQDLAAMKILIDLMRHSQDDRVRRAAANAILDRGCGRPPRATVEEKAAHPPTVVVYPLSGQR